MAVKNSLDLFGELNLFQTPQVTLSKEATSLFPNAETSSAVTKSLAEMDAQAQVDAQNAQKVRKQQEAYQQLVAKEHEESTRKLAEAIKHRERQEEKAKKEAEKKAKEAKKILDKKPTSFVSGDLSEFLNNEAFKKAGDLRQMHMASERATQIEQRLLAQGVDAESAKRSAHTFLGNVQGEVTRLKEEADTSIGWVKDIGSMLAKTFNDQQSAGNTKDAALIADAQEVLKRGQEASGWAVDEILDANPNVRKYLKKTTNLGLDSLSTFAIRDDLTFDQRKELDAEITKAYNTVKAKEAQNIKEADTWYNNVSREQQIERDNYQFELEQARLKYTNPDAPIHTAEGMAMVAESALIASKYPATMVVDQSGSVAVGVGGGLLQAGIGLALTPITGGASTANTAVGLARVANTLKNVSGVLFSGIASANMVQSDVINASRDSILHTDTSVLAKANPELWANMLELSGGNEELARQRLATIRADDHAGKALLLGLTAGFLGPEALVARAVNRNLATKAITESVEGIVAQSTAGITARSIAKNVGLWGVGTTAEGAEEGLTTYLTNLTINGVNPDHDLWDGVTESVGMGAVVGGMISSSALTTGAYGDIRRGTTVRDKAVAVAPLSDAAIAANVAKYKAAGDVDFNTLRTAMMNDLNSFEVNISNVFATSPDAIKRQRQMYYDTYIDNQEILSNLTKSQQNELRELAANAFGGAINTNSYSTAQDTTIMQVLRDATKTPVVGGQTNTELLDLWRVVHNKELDQVTDAKKANTMAQLYKRMFPEGTNTQENTRQRAERMTAIMRDLVNENSSISARDKAEYLRIAATYFDTAPRRDGDKVDATSGPNTDQRTDSSDDGRGVFGDEQNSPSEEKPATDNRQTDADTKSPRDGGQRQTNKPSGSTESASESSTVAEPSVQGPREASQAEATTDPAGTPDISSTTATGKGGVRQTSETTGPTVATDAQATPTPASSGVVGAPEAERSADGERNTTTTETDTLELSDVEAENIYNSLTQAHKTAIDMVVKDSKGDETSVSIVQGIVTNRDELPPYLDKLANYRAERYRESARKKLDGISQKVLEKYDALVQQPELDLVRQPELDLDTTEVSTADTEVSNETPQQDTSTESNPKRLTSKTKQEKSNETKNARSEQSIPAETATDEDGQNELGVVSSTDVEAGTVRGSSKEQNPLNSQEITSEEISNETSNDTNTGDLPITNEQSEPVDAPVGDATQPTEATASETQERGNKTTVTAGELSTTHTEVVNNEPALHNNQPVTIEGTTPSDQVVKVEPVVTEDGTTIKEVLVPEGEHTPAELEASDKFDTDPIPSDITAEDGRSIYEIAIELADSVGYATLDVINPNKLQSKKNRKGKIETPAPDEKRPADKERKDRLYTNENALLREVRERLYNTVQQSDNTRAQWLELMLATENGGDLLELINSTEFIQSGIDAAMSDSSVASARAPIEKFWLWNPKHTDPRYRDKKFGGARAVGQKIGSVIAGITPHFDDWVNSIPGVPRTGMAQDSNVLSVSLGKIDAQRGAIHGFVHKTYIQPVLDLTRDMTFKYSQHEDDVGNDFGNYATYTHVLEEGASALFANAEQEISYLRDRISATIKETKALHNDFNNEEFTEDTLFDGKLVKSNESRLADHQKDSYKKLVADYIKLTSEVEKAERNLTRSKDVYYGKKSRSDYSTGVKLPNGMTKEELEQELKAFEAKYEKADLETVADKVYQAYRGMQATGVAYGVYDSQTLKEFNSNKFEKYVPLYHAKKDKPNEYEEDVVNVSMFDGFEGESLIHQYKTLGLTRDISRFRRKGSVSRGQDAITNLGLAARNLSGRAASVEFEQNIQGLFEGTLSQPILDGKPTKEQIAGFHTGLVQKGVVDGLVRIRADIPKRYIPSEFADIIPVVAKGWEIDENGEYKSVTYNYYFTDKVIQAELTHKVDINHKFNTNSIVANIRTLTRWRASYMTSRSPSWNFWNFFKEMFERGTTLMFRPVVDDNGERVSGTKLAANFARNLTTLAANPQVHEEVYRYLAFREVKTPIQREVHNLYASGTIQLVTDLTDKYNLLGEQERSTLDNLAIKIEKGILKAGTQSSFTNWSTLKGADLIQQYHLRVAETPQVLNALAMFKAYKDAGVNTREARHRVRDAFDPTRVKSNFMMMLSNFFPFVRSAGAGNYNTMRTIGDVLYRDGPKAKVKFALLGLSAYALLQIASYAFGDDEDGNDLLAQLPQSELNRGVPIRLSDGKVIYFPVGHGILNMVWSTVTSVHKLLHGTSSVWDLVNNTIDQTIKNTAPIQAPTTDSVANSGGKALILNAMPTMVLPIVEVILNQTQFGSNNIVRRETPNGERDSDQDNFTTPEVYKEIAKDLYKMTGGVIDWRPENIHHLARAYAGVGPFRAIDASLQDKGEKTAGVFVNKGEYFGPLATAVGLDAGISTSVLSAESRYWEMFKHQAKILGKYNIQVTMPAGETYDKVDVSHLDLSKENPDRETRAERYAHQLTKAGATREETQFVVNMELAESTRTKLQKELQTVGGSYYNSIYKGTASEYTKSDTQERAIALRDFYEQAVRDNNQFVYGKK